MPPDALSPVYLIALLRVPDEWESSWTAVIQFPDRATAIRWYQSNEYAPLKKLRVEELTTGGAVALFDGYQSPTINDGGN